MRIFGRRNLFEIEAFEWPENTLHAKQLTTYTHATYLIWGGPALLSTSKKGKQKQGGKEQKKKKKKFKKIF
jgi:hypothetical protein